MGFVEDWSRFLKEVLPPRPPLPWEKPVEEIPPEKPEKPPEYPPEKPPEEKPPAPPLAPPVVPVEVVGYWELDYRIPKDGRHYACFANLYKRDKSVGGRRAGDSGMLIMNVRWITDNVAGVTTATTARKWNGPEKGWLTDMGVFEYIPDRYDAPITAPIDQGHFPDSDYDWVWANSWEGAPYSGGYAFSGGHCYYPTGPEGRYGLMIEGKRVKFIRKYRLTETGTGIRVRIYVSGPPPGPLVETYFHRAGEVGAERLTWAAWAREILPPGPRLPRFPRPPMLI